MTSQHPHRGGALARALRAVSAAALLAAGAAQGSVPTMNDCLEGSDFIEHAAQARDNGVERRVFVERFDADVTLIHAFPPDLRWFVRDADDERFLHAQVERVFDAPTTPANHRSAFLRACFGRFGV